MNNDLIWVQELKLFDLLILKSIIDINGFNDTFISQKEIILNLQSKYIQYIPEFNISRSSVSQRIKFLSRNNLIYKKNSYILLLKLNPNYVNQIFNIVYGVFTISGVLKWKYIK